MSRLHRHWLQDCCAKKEKSVVLAMEETRKHGVHLFFLADLWEYYTMSKEYYDSRQSGGLSCCTVLGNKHKQPVSSDALLSPYRRSQVFLIQRFLACKYSLQRLECTYPLRGRLPFNGASHSNLKKKKLGKKINEAESFSSWCFALVSSSVTLVVVVVVVVVVRKR